ncbi:unnamed protein product [Amoebophrya sp. A25]|nr:unnamed protein product [Amoebophrya sp. A25]|eukprot:GSA25T00010958001.1
MAPTRGDGGAVPSTKQLSNVNWFQAANNYISARQSAMRRFQLLRDRIPPGAKWLNDRTIELEDAEANTADMEDGAERHVIMEFPPLDNRSFYCINAFDPDSQVPEAGRPAYRTGGSSSSSSKRRGAPTTGGDAASFSKGGQFSEWRRVSEIHVKARLFPIDDKGHYGRVFQGGLQNAYLIGALQALSLRPKLLQDLFAYTDVDKAVYSLLLYKNGQYCCVEVDDLIPCDAQGLPVTCVSEEYPYILWPTIAEKAYAKLHTSARGLDSVGWEIIGEGGSVEEALVDLTGGVGGRWYCCDVSPDRLFVYLHALQRECIFTCSINHQACSTRGVRLTPHFSYTINRACEFEGQCFVQLHCGAAWLADGGLSDHTPYGLTHDPRFPELESDGFFWISIFDFASYFETVHECRLVNSGDRGGIVNMPPPRLAFQVTPCYVREPMYENVHACADLITSDTRPEFLISFAERNRHNEIYCSLSQTDERLNQLGAGSRFQHIPMLLKVYEQVEVEGEKCYAFVSKSGWMDNARDSVVSFKTPGSGIFLVTVELPPKIPEKNKFLAAIKEVSAGEGSPQEVQMGDEVVVNRMIFRVYSTRPVYVAVNRGAHSSFSGKQHTFVEPRADFPKAIRWSFVGSRNPQHQLRPDIAETWDDTEGCSVPFASRVDKIQLDRVGIGLGSAADDDTGCVAM